ncbi:replication initiator [Actinoplanes sp. NPDC051346]|uniref:replication initiator n=1 Tax=Actinoplanes sp. NPDC051346 TaxID=3155048 RepID=UPI00342EDACA
MQRRGVVHFHAIIHLDGYDPDDPDRPRRCWTPPTSRPPLTMPPATVGFTTDPHPAERGGWDIGWGARVLTKLVTVAAEGQVTDAQVAAYLAKYATKSTEVTGHGGERQDGAAGARRLHTDDHPQRVRAGVAGRAGPGRWLTVLSGSRKRRPHRLGAGHDRRSVRGAQSVPDPDQQALPLVRALKWVRRCSTSRTRAGSAAGGPGRSRWPASSRSTSRSGRR